MRSRRSAGAILRTVAAIALADLLPGPVDAQTELLSTPIIVNAYTTWSQVTPAVAADGNGGFVVAWAGSGPGDLGVFADHMLADGERAGDDLAVSTHPTAIDSEPAIATDGAGSFAVVWQRRFDYGGSYYLVGRALDSTGTPVGSEFQIAASATENGEHPQIAANPDGDGFVVVWQGADGYGSGVFGRLLDSSGAPAGTEFQVNTYTTRSQERPSVAGSSGHGFVVAWKDTDGLLAVRRFDGAANPSGAESRVSPSPGFAVGPALSTAMRDDGSAIAAWQGGYDGSSTGIFAQRFDSDGSPFGTAFQINTYTLNAQFAPVVAFTPDGDLVAAWLEGFYDGIRVRRFDSTGTPRGDDRPIHFSLRRSNEDPDVAVLADGRVAFVWTGQQYGLSDSPDGSGSSVLGVIACIDDSGNDADGDGIGDACDPCNDLAGSTMTIKTRLRLDLISGNYGLNAGASPPDNDKLSLTGELVLPAGFTFADIDPATSPVRLRLELADRRAIVDTELASAAFGGSGTAGWRTNGKGTKWLYRDKTASPRAGIVSARIDDRSKRAPGQVRIKIKGKNGFYPVLYGTFPYQATVVLGDGAAGECGRTAFAPGDCFFGNLDKTVTCR